MDEPKHESKLEVTKDSLRWELTFPGDGLNAGRIVIYKYPNAPIWGVIGANGPVFHVNREILEEMQAIINFALNHWE